MTRLNISRGLAYANRSLLKTQGLDFLASPSSQQAVTPYRRPLMPPIQTTQAAPTQHAYGDRVRLEVSYAR